MKAFLAILQFLVQYPFIFFILLLIILILIFIFKSEFKVFILNKLPFLKDKMIKPLSLFCDDVKHVYIFKSHVVIPTYSLLYKSLMKFIDKQRKNGEVLVVDLTHIVQVNSETEEAIRDSLRDTVKNNNVRIEVVFPKKKLGKLYKDIEEFIKEKSCKSIILFKDERIKKRKTQVKNEK